MSKRPAPWTLTGYRSNLTINILIPGELGLELAER